MDAFSKPLRNLKPNPPEQPEEDPNSQHGSLDVGIGQNLIEEDHDEQHRETDECESQEKRDSENQEPRFEGHLWLWRREVPAAAQGTNFGIPRVDVQPGA
jgi:hypothetical protein